MNLHSCPICGKLNPNISRCDECIAKLDGKCSICALPMSAFEIQRKITAHFACIFNASYGDRG